MKEELTVMRAVAQSHNWHNAPEGSPERIAYTGADKALNAKPAPKAETKPETKTSPKKGKK